MKKNDFKTFDFLFILFILFIFSSIFILFFNILSHFENKEYKKNIFVQEYSYYSDLLNPNFNGFTYEYMQDCYSNNVFNSISSYEIFKICAKNYVDHAETYEYSILFNQEFSKAELNPYSLSEPIE